MRYRLALILLLIGLAAAPAHAGIIFGRKKEKPDPKQRVPELVSLLEADKDGDKRESAAEELRNYDPSVFQEIVPALIKAMQNDPKPGVRIEAAHSLARLRPVSTTVGEALEAAVSKDSSMRVRLQARSALLQYHWAGYRGKKGDVPPLTPTKEPPLAGDNKYPPAIDTTTPVPVPITPAPTPGPTVPAIPLPKSGTPAPIKPKTPDKDPLETLPPPVTEKKKDPPKPGAKELDDLPPPPPAKPGTPMPPNKTSAQGPILP